jgi:hypothetical protein
MELAQESASWSATIDSGSRVMESGVDATKMRPSVESFWKKP